MNDEGLLRIARMLEAQIQMEPVGTVYLEMKGEKIMGCYSHDFMLRPEYECLELDLLDAYTKVKERLGDTIKATVLKYYRLAANLKIDELAKLLDISEEAVENWESDIDLPDDEFYKHIMRVVLEKFAERVFNE